MQKLRFFFILLLMAAGMQAQNIPLLKYEQLESRIAGEKAELLVVNFWATTCAPCVKELPHFMEVNAEYKDDPGFKMLLVSLDRAKDLERVKKFMKDREITAEVVVLDDNKRMNTWIPRINLDWGGEIPVTLIYKNNEQVYFQNGEMSKEELQQVIKQHLNP
ncbi:TlpA family protein disulfide reductase [Chryseobacterium sp. MFBS3-17]|uniref:TlpA family protein disulfide reductase n=1 Tax=Chryseobacterium sp. MFBS3-17 TaxID=2886689 RepID=UPI001D0E0FE0|nr:TlpA disulfide reductase family protein [Chryseobacterium sp. MFBS3-17]MCC2590607.1 TlpA family protein disulfide reductase [Chryseobacterium sp. MFBS3-17]